VGIRKGLNTIVGFRVRGIARPPLAYI